MGGQTARDFANLVDEGAITQRAAIAYHLSNNHYPPVHQIFVDTAIEAIVKGNAGEYDAPILMPNGKTKSVGEIIEGLHLSYFINQDEEPA